MCSVLEAGQIRRQLREVLKLRRAFGQIALEPPHRRPLVLRRSALRVQVDELQGILEREVRQLAGGVLGQPECSALDRASEADVGVRLSRHRTYVLTCYFEIIDTSLRIAEYRLTTAQETGDPSAEVPLG